MPHPIIEALALKELPAPETELLQKILQDNLVTLRAQQLMVEHFAAAAILQLHPVERLALLKRISPAPKAQGRAAWTLATTPNLGETYVRAQCSTCHQTMAFRQPELRQWTVRENFNGDQQARLVSGITPDELKKNLGLAWFHCGHSDKVPREIAALWEQHLQKLVAA